MQQCAGTFYERWEAGVEYHFQEFKSPTPRRKWYLTTGRRAHSMVLDPIPQPLPVHFLGSRPQPPTSPFYCLEGNNVPTHSRQATIEDDNVPTHCCLQGFGDDFGDVICGVGMLLDDTLWLWQ